MNVCMYVMYIFMYVCIYECMFLRMYVCIYICTYLYIYLYMSVHIYVCLYICMQICMYVIMYVNKICNKKPLLHLVGILFPRLYLCLYVCVCVYVCSKFVCLFSWRYNPLGIVFYSPPSGPGPPHLRGFLITHNDAPQSVGLLWTNDQPVAETSSWQHKTLTTDKHPCSRQGRIKLFGAPRQWKNFRPLFQAVFLSGGGGISPPPRLSQTPRLPVPRQK